MILAFIIPSKPNFWCLNRGKDDEENIPLSPALLDWNHVQQKFPWSTLFLLGGGLALSDASNASGLSIWIGQSLSGLAVLPPIAILILMCSLTSALTEVASNTALASILLPVVAQIVKKKSKILLNLNFANHLHILSEHRD